MRLRGVEYLRWRDGGPAEITYDEIQYAGLQVNIEIRSHDDGLYRVFIGCYSPSGLRITERECVSQFRRAHNALKWAKVMSSDALWFSDQDLTM